MTKTTKPSEGEEKSQIRRKSKKHPLESGINGIIYAVVGSPKKDHVKFDKDALKYLVNLTTAFIAKTTQTASKVEHAKKETLGKDAIEVAARTQLSTIVSEKKRDAIIASANKALIKFLASAPKKKETATKKQQQQEEEEEESAKTEDKDNMETEEKNE